MLLRVDSFGWLELIKEHKSSILPFLDGKSLSMLARTNTRFVLFLLSEEFWGSRQYVKAIRDVIYKEFKPQGTFFENPGYFKRLVVICQCSDMTCATQERQVYWDDLRILSKSSSRGIAKSFLKKFFPEYIGDKSPIRITHAINRSCITEDGRVYQEEKIGKLDWALGDVIFEIPGIIAKYKAIRYDENMYHLIGTPAD